MVSGELSDTDEAICNYVARKSEPESWNGDEESNWCLDRQPEIDYFGFGPRGLDIEEWRCPHPAMETDDGTAQECTFHAEDLPDDVNWRQEILEEDGPGPNESVRGALTETAETVLGTCAKGNGLVDAQAALGADPAIDSDAGDGTGGAVGGLRSLLEWFVDLITGFLKWLSTLFE